MRLACCRQYCDVGFGARAVGLRARDGGLLLGRVDLDERRADAHALAGLHEDARDQPFDFRLNRRRAERAQRGDELRRVFDRGRRERAECDGGRWRRARALRRRAAAAGCGQPSGDGRDGRDRPDGLARSE